MDLHSDINGPGQACLVSGKHSNKNERGKHEGQMLSTRDEQQARSAVTVHDATVSLSEGLLRLVLGCTLLLEFFVRPCCFI